MHSTADAFQALGEAEAELAHLNRCGVIDAVLTDDVDALVFGALRVIKNSSLTLSGNKSNPALDSEGKPSKHHAMIYTAEAIRRHPEVGLTRGGFVLFAMLVKGDYGDGVRDVGKGIAHGLARCGFGDELLEIFHRHSNEDIRPALARWRSSVNSELHTNSRKQLRHPYPTLSLPSDFPNMQILKNYIDPICSARVGSLGGGNMRDNGELNLARAAAFCEEKFGEWGYRTAIIKRFRSLMWEAAIMRVIRRAALEADEKERTKRLEHGESSAIKGPLTPSLAEAVGTPAYLVKKYLDMTDVDHRRAAFVTRPSFEGHNSGNRPLITKIFGTRQHVSTDGLLEYRVEVCPSQLVELAQSGIKGKRPEPASDSAAFDDKLIQGSSQATKRTPAKLPPDPHSNMRVWIPVSIVRQVYPGLAVDYEAEQEKSTRKAPASGVVRRQGKNKPRIDPGTEDQRSETERPTSPVRAVRTHCQMNLDDGAMKQGPHIHALGPDREGSCAGDNLRSQNRLEDNILSLPSASMRTLRSDAHPPSRFLFSMPNPDDPLESELEDEEDSNGAPPSWFDQLFNQVMGFDKGRSPDYTMRRKEKAGPPRKRPFYHSVAVAPSGSHEDHIHPGAKKRKVESRSTQSHFISPPRPRVRPRLDPDVLEVFSDSEEEEIFRPISVCIGKPLRPPSIPKRASAPDACAPQRQSYPQPSYQENDLTMGNVEVIIDLT
ncbi:XPG I-region-domain-containing protein [Suillus ampliporus]|nr:XPG I-region-domain-containing protein [Suillus ampliporus]